jgi:hypothetical protein
VGTKLKPSLGVFYGLKPESNSCKTQFLFELYEKYSADLFTKEKVKKRKQVV